MTDNHDNNWQGQPGMTIMTTTTDNDDSNWQCQQQLTMLITADNVNNNWHCWQQLTMSTTTDNDDDNNWQCWQQLTMMPTTTYNDDGNSWQCRQQLTMSTMTDNDANSHWRRCQKSIWRALIMKDKMLVVLFFQKDFVNPSQDDSVQWLQLPWGTLVYIMEETAWDWRLYYTKNDQRHHIAGQWIIRALYY